MISVRLEQPGDSLGIRCLLDLVFGADRHRKTVYRLRDGVLPVRTLCLVAEYMGELRGSLRFWPVQIESNHLAYDALLLGPLAVDPGIRGHGIGDCLVREGLKRAEKAGHTRVLLVGDQSYYSVFGFTQTLTQNLMLPGPVELDRFLGYALAHGAFEGVKGCVVPVASETTRSCLNQAK